MLSAQRAQVAFPWIFKNFIKRKLLTFIIFEISFAFPFVYGLGIELYVFLSLD